MTAPAPGRILISSEQIAQRIGELGARISADYAGRELVLVGVLKGSLFCLADLARHISVPLRYEFVMVSTYGDSTAPERAPELLFASDLRLKGSHVLLVEDIIDTGHTIDFVRRTLAAESPESLRVATLLDKPARRAVAVPIDYAGFEVPDCFVVGYGLDYAQRFRNLPFVAVLDGIG